jgi:Rrf2 family cysteine metabolism transcriptional repressor
MRMSTRGRYGARVMLELALRHKDGAISIKDIAESQDISAKYLVQIVTSLKAAGLVVSIRGSGGGYILARPPSQISLGEVIRSLEGSIAPVHCADEASVCPRTDFCVTHDVWVEMKKSIDNIVDSLSLEKMAKRQKKKDAKTRARQGIAK